jgi:hypothetical protein
MSWDFTREDSAAIKVQAPAEATDYRGRRS